jgi:hypothetical protein
MGGTLLALMSYEGLFGDVVGMCEGRLLCWAVAWLWS